MGVIDSYNKYRVDRTEKNLLELQQEAYLAIDAQKTKFYSNLPEYLVDEAKLRLCQYLLKRANENAQLGYNNILNNMNKSFALSIDKTQTKITTLYREDDINVINNNILDKILKLDRVKRMEASLLLIVRDFNYTNLNLTSIKENVINSFKEEDSNNFDVMISLRTVYFLSELSSYGLANKILLLLLGCSRFSTLLIYNSELNCGLDLISVDKFIELYESFRNSTISELLDRYKDNRNIFSNLRGSYEEFLLDSYINSVLDKIDSISNLNKDIDIESLSKIDKLLNTLMNSYSTSIKSLNSMIIDIDKNRNTNNENKK